MHVVLNDISHSDYFWRQSARPSVAKAFSLTEFCIILTLAPTYPLWSWFCSAKNLNTAPCYSWGRDFSSSRSPSKTGDVTRKNCCQQQRPRCSWWRQFAGSEDLLSYEWMSSSSILWPQLPCSQEEQPVFLDQQIPRLFRAGERSLLAHFVFLQEVLLCISQVFPLYLILLFPRDWKSAIVLLKCIGLGKKIPKPVNRIWLYSGCLVLDVSVF